MLLVIGACAGRTGSSLAAHRGANNVHCVYTRPESASRTPEVSPFCIHQSDGGAYVLVHNESFLIHPEDPVWQHYHPFRWWLSPHGIAGACALLLGPLQFSDRLRQRFTKFHRVAGRIYVTSALILAPLGAYIQYFQERMGAPRSFSVAGLVDAILLIMTTAIAFAFILNGKVQQHRQWMTRSFAVALVFVEVRVVQGVTGWENLGLAATETVVWSCLAFSILSADIVLQVQELRRSRPVPARVQAASGSA